MADSFLAQSRVPEFGHLLAIMREMMEESPLP